MLRNWGGIVDVTPDRSPIIAKTPVPGLYVNCGWGTGGFKATPGSAHVFAWTIARDEPHPINAPFTHRALPRRLLDRRGRRRGRGALRPPAAMLLIPCPYCGERPEIEFAYGGEAHIARPRKPGGARRPGVDRLSVHARQHQGRARRALAALRTAAAASSTRCATRPPIIFSRPTGRASRGPISATPADAHRELAHRRTAGASIEHGRCGSPSTAVVRRLRRRHAGLGAARQRRAPGRPLVQISPPARHSGRGLRRAERAGDREPRCGAPHAQPARHAGRAVRRLERREPEPLAEPQLRRRRA